MFQPTSLPRVEVRLGVNVSQRLVVSIHSTLVTTDSAGVGSFQLILLAQVSMGVPTLCARTRSYGEAITQPIQNSLHTLLEVQVWCTH